MRRFADIRTALAAAAACLLGVPSPAQEAVPPATPTAGAQPATRPEPAPNPIVVGPGQPRPSQVLPPPKPLRSRAISPEVAAQLAAAAPKFTPPPPKAPEPVEEEVDLREVDKPQNHIIRLPKVIVREPRPAVLTERAVNTKKGLEDIAMRRYLTDMDRALNRFTVPLFGTSAEQRAMAMYEEDERLRNMADLNDQARMVGAGDKEAGAYVKRQVDSTFVRPGSFDWRPIGR